MTEHTPGPRYTPLVQSLPQTVPFVTPETLERQRGAAFRARLGANENGFGPSPHAIAAMAREAAEAWKYGDAECHELRMALAAHHGVPAEAVLVGEGIDGLLGNLCRLMIAPGDRVVATRGSYPTFAYHVAGFGGEMLHEPFKGDHENPQALIARAKSSDAKLVYLSNPDNPMGSWHDAATVQAMIDDVPDGCLMVLDEAYIEFAPEGTAPPLDVSDRRVIRFRTFSKAYGLAGIRCGYAIAHPDLIASFDKIRNHFGMGRVGPAGARAALADQDWLTHVQAEAATARARIGDIAIAAGLQPLPSAANFVTVDCGGDGDLARAVLAELAARDVFVRMPFTAPQDRCIRISCAPEAELAVLEAELPAALAAARTSVQQAQARDANAP